jgi:hypothetical protein
MLEVPRDIRAYHEAGHAVVAAMLGLRVGRVTIRPEGEVGGRMVIDCADARAMPMEARLMVCLAGSVGTWVGPAADDSSAVWQGMSGDLDAIYALLGVDSSKALADPRVRSAMERLADLIYQEPAEPAIHALASMLMEREELVIAADTEAARLLVSLRP